MRYSACGAKVTTQIGPAAATWLSAFRRGEPTLLRDLFVEHAPAIRRLLREGFATPNGRFSGMRSHFDLDCAVQEVFRKAFELKARASYDGRAPFVAYLRAIARNHALNTLRRREDAHEPATVARLVNGSATAVTQTPEEQLQRAELRALVQRFKQGCTAFERELLDKRYLESLSQQDTAQELRCTRRKVRTVEALLRKRLARTLREAGEP